MKEKKKGSQSDARQCIHTVLLCNNIAEDPMVMHTFIHSFFNLAVSCLLKFKQQIRFCVLLSPLHVQ